MPPKGKHHSKSAKAKMSKAAKKRWRLKAKEAGQMTFAYEQVEAPPIGQTGDGQSPEAFGVSKTLSERGSRYGDFSDNARISQDLKGVCESEAGWDKMSDLHREGLCMILQKIARILNGDPDYKDNWHDIQGYAKLVEDRL